MTIESGAESATVETIPNPPADAGFSLDQQPQESQEPVRDWEAEASEMGWTPREKWRGKPEEWKDAETFVKRGEEFVPFVRAYNKKLKEQLKTEREEFATRLQRIEKMTSTSVEAQRKQYEARIAELEKAKRWAAHNGRSDDYDAYDQELKQVQRQAPTIEPEPEPKNPNADIEKAWTAKNTWYGTDQDLTVYANGYSQRLAQENPDMPFEENLRRTEARVREKFPQFFRTGANGHAPVDGGGQAPAAPRDNSQFGKLPTEAKAQFQRDVKAGLYKDSATDRESWAKAYFS